MANASILADINLYVRANTPPANAAHVHGDVYRVTFAVENGGITIMGQAVDLREALNGALEALDAAHPKIATADHYSRLAQEAGL